MSGIAAWSSMKPDAASPEPRGAPIRQIFGYRRNRNRHPLPKYYILAWLPTQET